MPACSMATVTRAANLQDGRRGGLNTVLRAPAVVPALGLVHLRSVEPRGPLKLTWCTSRGAEYASTQLVLRGSDAGRSVDALVEL